MSKSDLSRQKSPTAYPKESFQSIDDYYLQTEEDEYTLNQRTKTKTIQLQEKEISKIPPNIMPGGNNNSTLHQSQSQRLMFEKPKFIARSIDHPNQQNNNNINVKSTNSNDRQSTIERPTTPKIMKKSTQHNFSITQIKGEAMQSIRESDDEKTDKKQHNNNIMNYTEFNSSKSIPQRTLLSINSKNDTFMINNNPINLQDIQKRNKTTKSETKSITQFKENIFAKDTKQDGLIDIKTNQLFGLGPRYDPDGNIITHTIVGKPEWYLQAQEDQRTHKRSIDSPKQRLNKKISMASFQSKTSSVRVKSSIDTISRVEKKKKTSQKIIGEQYSKEQLVRKLENFEKNIEMNKLKEDKDLEKVQFFEKVIEEKQKHQLEQFEKTAQKWDKINLKISEKVLRLPNNTLLKSSIPQFRQKVEVSTLLEQVKNPNEILGDKFWEATLRDKYIDYTKIKTGQETEDQQIYNNKDQEDIIDNNRQDRRISSSHQHNRSFYRELSYSKGTKVPVLFKKDVEIIKHPKLTNNNSNLTGQTGTNQQNTLQYQTLGQFFGSMNSNQVNSLSRNNGTSGSGGRPLMSQQMSRRPFSQQSISTTSYRAKTPFNCTEFANANEFMNSIQSSTINYGGTGIGNQLNISYIPKNIHNTSSDKISQFFNAITADHDEFFVKGESKLNNEKQALLNDGNHNQYLYRTLNNDEVNQIEMMRNAKLLKSHEAKDHQNDSHTTKTKGEQQQQQGIHQQNSGAIMKQSTFGHHQKKQSNISEISFNSKDKQQQRGLERQTAHLGQNFGNQSNHNFNNNGDIQSNQSLKQSRSFKDNHLSLLTQSIKRSAFNSPFQPN